MPGIADVQNYKCKVYLLPSVFRLAIEKVVLDLHIKPEGPKGHSCSVSRVGRRKPIAGQPRGLVEAEVPLELQEQLEEREVVDKSPIECSLLAWRSVEVLLQEPREEWLCL